MTVAPQQPLVERVAQAIHDVDYREEGFILALAQAALAACRAEEMHELLTQIASYPDANVISDAHYVVRKRARALLADLYREQTGGAVQPIAPTTDQPVDCREAFESRRTPNLDLKRNEDGSYRYQAAQLAFRDFADGWQAASSACPVRETVEGYFNHMRRFADFAIAAFETSPDATFKHSAKYMITEIEGDQP